MEYLKDERTLGEKFEDFSKSLDRVCTDGYDIMGDKKMGEKEKKEFIDILANIKGAKKAAYMIMEKYSDVKKADREKIDAKVDDFIKGLDLEDK